MSWRKVLWGAGAWTVVSIGFALEIHIMAHIMHNPAPLSAFLFMMIAGGMTGGTFYCVSRCDDAR